MYKATFKQHMLKQISFFIFVIALSIQASHKSSYAAEIQQEQPNYEISNAGIADEIEKSILLDKKSYEMIAANKAMLRQKKEGTGAIKSPGKTNNGKTNKKPERNKKNKSKTRSSKLHSDDDLDQSLITKSFGAPITSPITSKTKNLDTRQKEQLAYDAVSSRQYEVAISLYKEILEVEPDNFYAKFSLAVVYQQLEQFRQSKVLYYELLKSNPVRQQDVISNLLAILIEESPNEAIPLLSRLMAQNPNSPYIFAQAAIAHEKTKNYEQAIALFRKSLDLDPGNVAYKYNLAVTYDKSEKYLKAIELYSEIIDNYSDNVQIASIDQIKKRVEALRKKI